MYKVTIEEINDTKTVINNRCRYNDKYFKGYLSSSNREDYYNYLEIEHKLFNIDKLFNFIINKGLTSTFKGQKLKRGDYVVWKNYYGVYWKHTVIGYDNKGNLYIDTDAYWCNHNELKEEL